MATRTKRKRDIRTSRGRGEENDHRSRCYGKAWRGSTTHLLFGSRHAPRAARPAGESYFFLGFDWQRVTIWREGGRHTECAYHVESPSASSCSTARARLSSARAA